MGPAHALPHNTLPVLPAARGVARLPSCKAHFTTPSNLPAPLSPPNCRMFVGLALGCIINWAARTPRHLHYHVIATSGD